MNTIDNPTHLSFAGLAVAVIAVFIIFTNAAMTDVLQFDKIAIANGEIWRLITGHITHWDWDHLIWDVVALTITGILCIRLNANHFWLIIGLSPLILSIYTLCVHKDIHYYRGLSGIDSSLAAYAAVRFIIDSYKRGNTRAVAFFLAIILGFICKITYEYASGTGFFVHTTTFQTMPSIHILGAAVGIGVLAMQSCRLE